MSLVKSLFSAKQKVFYKLFEELVDNLEKVGEAFLEFSKVEKFTECEEVKNKIKDLEHRCDDNTHEILIELGKNFITPFDREDIHDLANRLDDVADHINTSANRLILYKLYPLDNYVKEFINLSSEGIIQLNKAIKQVRSMKNKRVITDALMAINTIERQADALYEKAISDLFDEENDMKLFIKKRDIYQKLELVTDVIEDAGNVIEGILIKYS